ncbi:MAG TPA: glycosyltransferase family 1 protein [Verrucomicrobiae bacterium]|nr:glycosyltransferase family 1 protein [Verrucomicrobiae bacterium]
MRIGISTSVIQQGRTGIAQYLFALLRGFARTESGHSFTLFVLERDLPLFDFVRPAMRLVPVEEQYRPPVRNIFWHQFHLPRLVREWELDVLHVPSYRRMLFPRPCRLVATIHDLAPFHVAGKYDWKRMLYGRWVARVLAARQDHVIAISGNTANDVRRFFRVRPERTTVIHNGLEHDRFNPGSREKAREWASHTHQLSKPFFLYVARLEHPGKNHVRVIAAFERFREATGLDWQLVFGGSDWHGAEAIHERARASSCAGDIRFLGFVPDGELPDLYRAAGAFVYPSLYEGFGMPPTEAMACGCPVICSTRGSLGEVVGEAAALVDPEREESIAEQMIAVAVDERVREQLRRAGLEQAQQFNWNTTASRTLEVYERVMSGYGAQRVPAATALAKTPMPAASGK